MRDALGTILEESDYYPYGGEIRISGTDPNRYKFTGKERDSESGLDNFDFRYYGSSMGRFMSPDDDSAQHPGNPQSWNLYSYVENKPLNHVDPDGHDCIYTLSQTSNLVTVAVERGACSGDNGTYISGTIDVNSLKYNGQTGDLSYSFQDSSGEKGGVGVIALNAPPPPGQLSSDQAQILSQAGAMGMAGVKWAAIEMGKQALGIGFGRLAAWGIESALAAKAAKAAEEAVDVNNLSNKIVRQMTGRGWTKQEILDTVREGDAYPATNKDTGGPATEYVSRSTGKFVVIDNKTGEVLQVSKAGYRPNHWEQ